MDLDRVLKDRLARRSREARPFRNLFAVSSDLCDATKHLIETEDSQFRPILERSIPIVAVTTIETYYRDILDATFRICDPELIRPVLKDIHRTKYDIDDLVQMHERSVHPLELVSSNQNFQSVEAVDSVFSKFLKKGLADSVIGMHVRIKDEPDTETEFSNEHLEALRKLFSLRHELVHNPNTTTEIINQGFPESLESTFYVVFVSEIVLGQMISENLDPELKNQTIA